MKGIPNHWTTLQKLMWLQALQGGGGGGELVTVTGISPLLLVNALAHSIKSLTQYGKCVQDGTPTPNASVDIMCNNGALKVGREIYTTPLGRTVYGGTLDVVTGELVVDRAAITLNGSEAWIKSSNGNVYYLTLNASTFPYGQSVEQHNVCDQYVFKGFATGGYNSFLSDGEYLLYKWVSSGQAREIAFKNNSITSVTDWKASLQSNPVQVVYELDTPQTYQLTPQTVEMIAERSTFQSNANGNIDITYYANGMLKTVSGNPVVITDADGQNAENVTVHIEPIQSGSGTPSPTNIRPISGMTDINITRIGGVVVDGTPEVLTITATGAETQTVNDIPMLLSVGDYADEAEIISGLLTHKVGFLILDGTEAWTEYSSGGNVYFADLDIDATFSLPSVCLCTHYQGVPSPIGASGLPNNSIKCGFRTDEQYNRRVYLKDTSLATVAAVSSFLAAQYAAGTPVILVYSLATETTEQTTAHALNSYEGTTVVEADTNVDPVTMTVEYKGVAA